MPGVIADRDTKDFRDLMQAWRRGELTREVLTQPARPTDTAAPLTVVLLEELPTGGRAKAEVVNYVTGRQVQDVMIVGHPVSLEPLLDEEGNPLPIDPEDPHYAGTVTIIVEVEGEPDIESDPIPLVSLAGEVEEILNRIPELKRRNLDVTLGNTEEFLIMRWRIAMDFPPEDPAGEDVEAWPLFKARVDIAGIVDVIVSNCPFVGTGRTVEVVDNIPVGDPTPLRAGAQCGVIWFPSMGAYGFSGAEPRKFSPPEEEEPTETTEPPGTTEPPETTEPPGTTEPPETTEPPGTTEPPETTEPPGTTEPPTTTEPPATTEPPTTTEPPATTEPPITTEPPLTTEPPNCGTCQWFVSEGFAFLFHYGCEGACDCDPPPDGTPDGSAESDCFGI